MSRDEKEFVSELQRLLIERIGRPRFDLWFGNAICLGSGEGQVVIRAGSQFVLDRLRRQFGADLEAAAQQLLGQTPRLTFCVAADAAAKPEGGPRLADAPPVRRAGQKRGRAPGEVRGGRFARLEDFVQGRGNRVAHTAACAVADRLGSVSPLLLYGPSGSGKTHLLEGIWSSVRGRGQLCRALLLSAEQFTTYFLAALRGGGLPSFRNKCREVQLLAIDDIQFFAGKRATIIELQHTVDTLLRRGRQLVLTADRPPASLKELGSELIARVSGGLVCGIDAADYQTRLGIARRAAARLRVRVPDEVIELVAAELSGDARQIAGALNRLEATSHAFGRPITVELARSALQDIFRATRRVVRLGDIEQAVCDVFGLEPRSLRNASKAKSVCQPRMLAMWLARKYTRAAFSEISQYFGRRSHSTVISAEKQVNRWVAQGELIRLGCDTCDVQDAIRRVESQLRTA